MRKLSEILTELREAEAKVVELERQLREGEYDSVEDRSACEDEEALDVVERGIYEPHGFIR